MSSSDEGGGAVTPRWRLALESWEFREVLVIVDVSVDMVGTMLLIFLGEMSIKASKDFSTCSSEVVHRGVTVFFKLFQTR